MARPEVLDRIKEAESEADGIVADAEEAREERIEEAREEADRIREEAREEAQEMKDARVAEAREEIEEEREAILAEGKEEREALESRAADQRDEVVEYTVELFTEAVHAQT
jgi:V/A-type H+-transporting ATPase subunit G/H